MTENPLLQQEIFEPKKNSGEKPGMELSRNQELENLKESLATIQSLIDHDQVVHSQNLESLENSFKKMMISLEGIDNTVDSVEKIPFLKKNVKIWQEIKDDNFANMSGLDLITDEIAKILSEHEGSLDLRGVFVLSPESAAALAKHEGYLNLSSLVTLPIDVAEQLGKHRGRLILEDITHLSDKAAEYLSKHDGELALPNLESISDIAAEHLAKFKGGLSVKHEILKKIGKYLEK